MDKDHANSIAITKILDKLQIPPMYVGRTKALYRSPISKEKHASFWLYFKTNTWYDYGVPAGGDLDGFVWRYLKFTGEAYTPVDVQRWIANMTKDGPLSQKSGKDDFATSEMNGPILTIKSVDPLRYKGLVRYLEGLGISEPLAIRYVKELKVHNRKTGKTFISIGVPNEDGGYELYNPVFTSFVGPCDITFFRGTSPSSRAIHIFRTIFDFLSVLSQLDCLTWRDDVIILHAHFNAARIAPYIQYYGYKTMYTWMDNDPDGHKATSFLHGFAKNQSGLVHLKMNRVYEDFLSVSSWHVASHADKGRLKL